MGLFWYLESTPLGALLYCIDTRIIYLLYTQIYYCLWRPYNPTIDVAYGVRVSWSNAVIDEAQS